MQRVMRPGHYLVTCDLSGFVFWDDETILQWNGLRVARRFADVRNPQDFPVRIREGPPPPDTRPEGTDVYQVAPVTPADL